MSSQTKTKFKKAKLPQIPIYKELELQHKKYTPNPRITKLDQVEKDGADIALQTEWDYKLQNLSLSDQVSTIALLTTLLLLNLIRSFFSHTHLCTYLLIGLVIHKKPTPHSSI